MMKKRDRWGSNTAFLLAAVGSAVGLGNIWGFPYKMGMNGGFAFLLIYVLLAAFIGLVVMLCELALGRKTRRGAVGAYKQLGKKYKWIGTLAVISPFIILTFYCVLGGMVLRYALGFLAALFGLDGFSGAGSGYFSVLLYSPWSMFLFFAAFLFLTVFIVTGGIRGGIEKFTKPAMPALAVLLVIVIGYVALHPGAIEGYKFMFAPNLEPLRENFFGVLKTAAGQMFFSLSLGMGIMITYGSYLNKEENLQKNACIITVADTIIAVLSGMLVMPACAVFGVAYDGGPGLLFVSLQTVFLDGMGGFTGHLMGFLFYFFVFIAAITSSISLLEVCCTCILDWHGDAGRTGSRRSAALTLGVLIALVGLPVALDALGSGGAVIPAPYELFNRFFGTRYAPGGDIPMVIDCWLDFYDCISEGILMPLGALMMSLLIGWKLGFGVVREECLRDGNRLRAERFLELCLKFIVPVGLAVVLLAQLQDFFG